MKRMYDIYGIGFKPLYIHGKLIYPHDLTERTEDGKPIPSDFGFTLDDLREYEDKIENIEKSYPQSNDLQSFLYKIAGVLFVVTVIIFCCIGLEHSLWVIPVGLIEWGLCHLFYKYKDNENYRERQMRLRDVRSEKIEKYIKAYYTWINNDHIKYYDIV